MLAAKIHQRELTAMAVIIAVVLGAGAWMLLIPELKSEFNYMGKEVQRISDSVKPNHAAVTNKIEHIQRDVNQLKIDVAVDSATHRKEGK